MNWNQDGLTLEDLYINYNEQGSSYYGMEVSEQLNKLGVKVGYYSEMKMNGVDFIWDLEKFMKKYGEFNVLSGIIEYTKGGNARVITSYEISSKEDNEENLNSITILDYTCPEFTSYPNQEAEFEISNLRNAKLLTLHLRCGYTVGSRAGWPCIYLKNMVLSE